MEKVNLSKKDPHICIHKIDNLDTQKRLDKIIDKLEDIKKGGLTKDKDMGIGVLGSPTIVFPRQFRWALTADSAELEYYAKRVDLSYSHLTLSVELFEFVDPTSGKDCPVDEWIRKVSGNKTKENVTITMFDGCGVALYKTTFFEVKIADHNLLLDYAESDLVTHHITLKYKKSERAFLLGKKS